MIRSFESMMKNELVWSFVEGFKGTFRLAACLFMAVGSVITAFEKRELGEADKRRAHPPEHS
jgi:hypothetical protein